MLYVLVIDNYGDLESDCYHSAIIGIYDNFEKAKNKMQNLISEDVNNYDFVLDTESDINDFKVNDTIRVFKGHQENWCSYSEYTIYNKVVE